MKKLIELGNRFASQSDWTDFALTKFCLCAMGVLIGTAIPKKGKKAGQITAAGVFGVTYFVLMKKVIEVFLSMKEDDLEEEMF